MKRGTFLITRESPMTTKQDEKDARKEERAEVKDTLAHEKKEEQDVKEAKASEEDAEKAVQVAQAEAVAKRGMPTPTQAELDAIVRGEKVVLAPDGSPPDGHGHPVDHRLGRKVEADPEKDLERAGFKKVGKDAEPERSGGASYKTRAHVAEKRRGESEDA
jgi:hypothetical protein